MEMAVLVYESDIASVIKTFAVDDLCRFFRLVVIAEHHIFSADQYFVLFTYLHFDTVKRFTNGADLVIVGTVSADDAGLGHSVALQDRNSRSPERIRQFLGKRRAARNKEPQFTAYPRAPFRINQPARERVFCRQGRGYRFALVLCCPVILSDAERPIEQLCFHSAGSFPLRSEEHTSELQSRLHLVCRL